MLRSVGELVALSQTTLTHKRFLSILVDRRFGVSFLMELDLSLGMQKYLVLFTKGSGVFPKFQPELGA